MTSILFVIVRIYGDNQFKLQLSKKQINFFDFLTQFSKFTQNFEHFETKYDTYKLCISKIMYCEDVVR